MTRQPFSSAPSWPLLDGRAARASQGTNWQHAQTGNKTQCRSRPDPPKSQHPPDFSCNISRGNFSDFEKFVTCLDKKYCEYCNLEQIKNFTQNVFFSVRNFYTQNGGAPNLGIFWGAHLRHPQGARTGIHHLEGEFW